MRHEREPFVAIDKAAKKAVARTIDTSTMSMMSPGRIVNKNESGRRISNTEIDRIERKVTEIMQKYCTPTHASASVGRYSALDRLSTSLSSVYEEKKKSARWALNQT